MKEILFLNSLLTPRLITVLYWIMLLIVLVSGLSIAFNPQSFSAFLFGILTIIGGVISVRVFCELLIVIFKIHDNTKKIADRQA
ncbi:MAG: DUF4282 domain-containing protein [Nitrospirae bacterium]|nr:DUF4282 domain-containing protein [Nitrospirota bacterium]